SEAHSRFPVGAAVPRPACKIGFAQIASDIWGKSRPIVQNAEPDSVVIIACVDGHALLREIDGIVDQIAQPMNKSRASRDYGFAGRLSSRGAVSELDVDLDTLRPQGRHDFLEEMAQRSMQKIIVLALAAAFRQLA